MRMKDNPGGVMLPLFWLEPLFSYYCRPTVFAAVKRKEGVDEICAHIENSLMEATYVD